MVKNVEMKKICLHLIYLFVACALFTSCSGDEGEALSVVALTAFVVIERKAVEPVLPLRLFKNQTISLSLVTEADDLNKIVSRFVV